MRGKYFFLIILLPLLTRCVEDPPVEPSAEANLRVTFVPVDSTIKLQLRQELNQGMIDDTNEDISYYDSLDNTGEGDYTEELELLNTQLDSLQAARTLLTTAINKLSEGIIRLDYLTADGSSGELNFVRESEVYALPLNANTLNSTYQIGYGSYSGEATFSYDIETLYEYRLVRLRGSRLDLVDYSFDSVKVKCPADTCTTDEILVTFYF